MPDNALAERGNEPPVSVGVFVGRVIAWAVVASITLLLFVPWWTGPCGVEPDPASDLVIHLGFERGWNFGNEIVWPFGPYGFLYSRSFYPADYTVTLLGSGFLSLAFLAALGAWARHLASGFFRGILLIVAGILVATLMLDNLFFLMIFLGLFLHLHQAGKGRILTVILASALGLAALVKFTLFALAGFVAAIAAVDDIGRHRRLPVFSLTFAMSLIAWWLLAGQPLSSLADFVWNRLTISAAYTSAMAHNGPFAEPIAFCCITLMLLAGMTWLEVSSRLPWAPFRAISAAGFLFVVFKEGFVRHDEHAVIATSVLLIAAISYAGLCASANVSRGAMALCLGSCVLSGGLLWWSMGVHTEEGLFGYIRWTVGTLDDRAAAFGRFVVEPGRMDGEYVDFMRDVRSESPLPQLGEETVDIYPHGQTELIANGLRYQPRPVIQSYMTYNDILSGLNAAHLRSAAAPQNIFLRVWPIDMRYPSLDDGLSWLEMLDRYSIVSETAEMLWLRRLASERGISLEQFEDRWIELDQDVQVPPTTDNDPIWARIDIDSTVVGHAAGLLYKTPWVYIEANGADGSQTLFTLVPGLTRGGFLLSPLVLDHHGFAALYGPGPDAEGDAVPLRSFKLSTYPRPGIFYGRRARMVLFRLKIPGRQDAAASTQQMP